MSDVQTLGKLNRGAPSVRKLNRIGAIENQFLIAIQTVSNINIEIICSIFKMHTSSALRIIHALQRKECIRIENDIIFLKDNTTFNFSNRSSINNFYDYLLQTRSFRIKTNPDFIQITTDFLYYHLLDEELSRNESLNKVKELNEFRYNQIVSGLIENLNYQVKNLKKKVTGWSENIYEVYIGEYEISLVYSNTNKPIEFTRDDLKFVEKKIQAECIFLFKKSLQEIYETVMEIAYLDYSKV